MPLNLKPKKVIIFKPSKANLCDNSEGKRWRTLVNILKSNKIFCFLPNFQLILTENKHLKSSKLKIDIYLTYEDYLGFNYIWNSCLVVFNLNPGLWNGVFYYDER